MQKALIALVVVLGLSGVSAYTYNRTVGFAVFVGSKEGAEANVHIYAKDLNYTVLGKSCAETDSDHDGYITCTGRFQGTSGTAEFKEALECGSGAWGARTGGCKPKYASYPPMAQAPAPVPTPAPAR